MLREIVCAYHFEQAAGATKQTLSSPSLSKAECDRNWIGIMKIRCRELYPLHCTPCTVFTFTSAIRGPSLVQEIKWEAGNLRERKVAAYTASNDTHLKQIAQSIKSWSDCSRHRLENQLQFTPFSVDIIRVKHLLAFRRM